MDLKSLIFILSPPSLTLFKILFQYNVLNIYNPTTKLQNCQQSSYKNVATTLHKARNSDNIVLKRDTKVVVMESVGERIKRLRKERKWTQEILGSKLGVKKAAVQKYESNRVVNLKQETIAKLAEIFEVPPSTFLNCSEWDKYAEEVNLSEQVHTIELVQKHYGKNAVTLLNFYVELTSIDRIKLLEYADKLHENSVKNIDVH